MERHPEYKYYIQHIDEKNRWIYIFDKDKSGWGEKVFDWSDEEESNGPIEFILRIKDANGWHVEEVGDGQFRFKEDNLGMVFQWDDLFGFVVIVEDLSRVDEVMEFMKNYME